MRRILILPLIALTLMAFKPFEQISPAPDLHAGNRVTHASQYLLTTRNQVDGSNPTSRQASVGSDRFLVTDLQAATPTPKPTGTPIPTPPPANPAENNMMIFFVVIAVIVIVVGVWINRQRNWGQ
jgi:hypothetical protein